MKTSRFYLLMSLFWLAGVLWLVISSSNAMADFGTSVCLFKQTTGLACPSCGTTRSIQALLHGDLLEALTINPLGLIGFAAIVILPCWFLADGLTKKTTMFLSWNFLETNLKKPVIYWPSILVIAANWVWNITKAL